MEQCRPGFLAVFMSHLLSLMSTSYDWSSSRAQEVQVFLGSNITPPQSSMGMCWKTFELSEGVYYKAQLINDFSTSIHLKILWQLFS